MGHMEATREFSATPEALWAVVSDLSTWDKWFAVHDKWLEQLPATLTPGVKLTANLMMLNMAAKIAWTFQTVDPPRALAFGGMGMGNVKANFRFGIEPAGAGSKFTITSDFKGALLKGPLGKVVEKEGGQQLETTLDRLGALASSTTG